MIEVWESIGRTLLALGAVLLLMGAAAWVARRVLPQRTVASGGTPIIQVVANSYLAPRKSITLVAIAGEYFVVGVSADALVPLGRIDDPSSKATIASSSAASDLPSMLSTHSVFEAEWWQEVAKHFRPEKKGGPDA